jgi:hypothetical protein
MCPFHANGFILICFTESLMILADDLETVSCDLTNLSYGNVK